MKQYLSLLQEILEKGTSKKDRTGIGTISLFGAQRRYNLSEGFPLLTTKKVFLKAVIYELLWFLRGDTNIRFLVKNNVRIWNEWAWEDFIKKNNLRDRCARYSDAWAKGMEEFIEKIKNDDDFAKKWGELGPIYGKQWVNWIGPDNTSINQIQNVIDLIRSDPSSRRLIVSGWNVGELQQLIREHHSAPPPCHTVFHFMVIDDKLSCQLYQRSADAFLGVPFNIASYSLLTMMMAQITNLKPGEFIHTFGDVHIYKNHLEQVKIQLLRAPKPLPTMKINPQVKDIFKFRFEDFTLENYNPHPPIKAPIAV